MTEELEFPTEYVEAQFDMLFEELDLDELGEIEFKADGTYTQTSNDEMSEGEWSTDLKNTLLTIVEDGYIQEMKITKLTDSELRLSISEVDDDDIDGDGKDDEFEIEITYTLEK